MTRLAVMRPPDKMEESVAAAVAMGFEPLCASPLRIVDGEAEDLDEFMGDLRQGKVHMVIMTSSTGVKALNELTRDRLEEGELASLMEKVNNVAIGPLTAKAMRSQGMQVSFIPDVYSSEGLVAQMDASSVKGRKVYVLRSDHGDALLIEALRSWGAEVREVVVYRLVKQTDSPGMDDLAKKCLDGAVDAYAFTSSLSALSFLESAGRYASREEVVKAINEKVVAAVGMPTKRRLEENGIRVDVVPANATFEEMLAALKEHLSDIASGR